jgi:5'-3' exonuclease
MAYLAKVGLADVVITEDSDLLAYGCPDVLFKLSRSGEVDHIHLADLPFNRSVSFAGFTHDNFIEVRLERYFVLRLLEIHVSHLIGDVIALEPCALYV